MGNGTTVDSKTKDYSGLGLGWEGFMKQVYSPDGEAKRKEEDISGWRLAERGLVMKTLSAPWAHSFHLAAVQ